MVTIEPYEESSDVTTKSAHNSIYVEAKFSILAYVQLQKSFNEKLLSKLADIFFWAIYQTRY